MRWLPQPYRWAIILLLGGLLVRGAIASFLPPGFDEAYYYLYTRHLDWSYFDHPVMVAFSTGIGVWLTGQVNQFTIRIGALLLHTGALLLLYLTSRRLFDQTAAVMTLAIATLIPIFLAAFGVLTLPDAPLIFCWSATLYVATLEFFPFPYHSYRPTWRLVILGFLVGLACLSKYHGAALGFGLLGFCLTDVNYRRALTSPWMVVSFAVFGLAIAPILIWNGQHDWISLRFQSGRAIPDRGYSLLELLGTFLIGVAYLFPPFGFPLWWATGKATWQQMAGTPIGKRWFRFWFPSVMLRRQPIPSRPSLAPTHALILWTTLPLIVGFTLMGGYRAILPTWAMPGFWSATLLLGERAAIWQERSPRGVQRWLGTSGAIVATVLLIALLHVNLGIFQKPSRYALFGGFLPPAADPSVQLIDIQQLRTGFATTPALQTALAQTKFLFTDNIFLAGQVGMAIAPLTATPITVMSDDPRGFAFWSTPNQWLGQNGLLIASSWQNQTDPNHYQPYFETIQKIADIPLWRGGAIVQTISVYECQRLLKPYPRPYGTAQPSATH